MVAIQTDWLTYERQTKVQVASWRPLVDCSYNLFQMDIQCTILLYAQNLKLRLRDSTQNFKLAASYMTQRHEASMYNKGRVHQSKRDIQVTKYQMSSGHSLGKKILFSTKEPNGADSLTGKEPCFNHFKFIQITENALQNKTRQHRI